MLKKTITFEDFNGKSRTEDHYFHLKKSELLKMEFSESTIVGDKLEGGLAAQLQGIMDRGSGREIMNAFEDVVRWSYGKRSEDGSTFRKSEADTEEFMQSQAYDALFLELVTDANAAAKFFNGIVPQDVSEQLEKSDDPKIVELRNKLAGNVPALNSNEPAEVSEPAVQISAEEYRRLTEGK